MKPRCPYCGSINTRQHSDNQIYEEYMIAQSSHRCNKCKKYFYRRFQLTQPEYKFHNYLTWNPNYSYTGTNNEPARILNPERDDLPNENTGRY